MAHSTRKRSINGIVLLDKPTNMTSNMALQIVKRLYCAEKAGHTGSLDPLASGMLPICFGEATKFSQFLLNAAKSYRVTAKLGQVTATGDAEGEILQEFSVPKLTPDLLEAALAKFRGEIQQIPSMYSALKHQGTPLYKLAREGKTIAREARPVNIYQLSLISFTEDTISMDVFCSKGTYVRTLVEDIGKALGCGGHVIQLHRYSLGPYEESQMISLLAMQEKADKGDLPGMDSVLLPLDSCLPEDWTTLNVSSNAAFYFCRGQAIRIPRAPDSGFVKLVMTPDRFLGVGEVLEDGRIAPRRLVNSSPTEVEEVS